LTRSREQLPTATYPALRPALQVDSFTVPERLQLLQCTELYLAGAADDSYFGRTQTGQREPLWKNFLVTQPYNVDWNSHPRPDIERIDRMLQPTLGYLW